MRPGTSLTVFVPTIANMASPAPASVASAMPAVMAWAVSRQVSSLFRETSCQTGWLAPMTYRMMKRPIPGAISPGVTLRGWDRLGGLRSSIPRYTALPSGISGPWRGRGAGRRGFPGQTSRRGVRSVAHAWIWARFAARLQADQPSPGLGPGLVGQPEHLLVQPVPELLVSRVCLV